MPQEATKKKGEKKIFMEETISQEIFTHFFINSGSNLIQSQILTLKLISNLTLTQTQTLILTLKHVNEKYAYE